VSLDDGQLHDGLGADGVGAALFRAGGVGLVGIVGTAGELVIRFGFG